MPDIMKPFVCIISVLACLTVSGHSAASLNVNEYRFHSLPETSYYAGIHSIAKDSIGRIWFSGSDAVYMYDGIAFNRCNDRITGFAPDSWWTFLQIVKAGDGNIYVGTNHGLMRYDYAGTEFIRITDGSISFLTTDEAGTVWMIRNDSIESWSVSGGNRSRKYPFESDMKVRPLTLTMACAGGDVWVASDGVLYRLDSASGKYSLFTDFRSSECLVRDVKVYDSDIYVLTAKEGIFRFSGGAG